MENSRYGSGASNPSAAAGKLLLALLLTVGLYFLAILIAMPITAVLTVTAGAIMIMKSLISSSLFVLAGLGVAAVLHSWYPKSSDSRKSDHSAGFFHYGAKVILHIPCRLPRILSF